MRGHGQTMWSFEKILDFLLSEGGLVVLVTLLLDF